MIALGVPLAADAPAVAATRLRVSPTNPIPRESIAIRGSLSTRVSRPVKLQYYSSGWRNIATKKSARTGAFAFRTRAVRGSRTYRVVAPRVRINGRTYKTEATPKRVVRTVRPVKRMRLVPAPVGQAPNTTATNLIPVATQFRPVRKGRVVTLQRYRSGAWRKVTAGRQNARGSVTFNIPVGAAQRYKHRAVASYAGVALRKARRPISVRPRTFNDNFSGTALDTNRWSYRTPGSRTGGGRKCSESSSKSVSVADGTLRLQTKRIAPDRADDPNTLLVDESWDNPDYDSSLTSECPYGQYYNGHIGTASKVTTKYGYMAARIKMQPQRGHHGGFWSQPQTSGSTGAEIDTVEYYGDTHGRIQHSVYVGNEPVAKVVERRNYLLGRDKTWSNSYHIFSVEWTPTMYIFRVDGHETFRTKRGVSQIDQYLITSLLSSDWELKWAAENGQLPSSNAWNPMYVDWVRVWAR